MRGTSKFVCTLALCATILGCATTEQGGFDREQIGRAVGAVAGGLLGSAVENSDLRPLAILLGAAGGAWLGGKIGANLSEADQVASEEAIADSLETMQDGEVTNWQSETTTASATFTPLSTRQETKELGILRDIRVEESAPIELLSEPYTAKKNSNVRSRPTTDSNIVGRLGAGEQVTAIGKVIGKDWIMVGKNGISVGYVFAPLVAPSSHAPQVTEAKPKVREAINLDEIQSDTRTAQVEGVNLDGVDLDAVVVADTIVASTSCRTMDYQITDEANKTEAGEFQACKGADGAWEIG